MIVQLTSTVTRLAILLPVGLAKTVGHRCTLPATANIRRTDGSSVVGLEMVELAARLAGVSAMRLAFIALGRHAVLAVTSLFDAGIGRCF